MFEHQLMLSFRFKACGRHIQRHHHICGRCSADTAALLTRSDRMTISAQRALQMNTG
jgi:hypothetical protein